MSSTGVQIQKRKKGRYVSIIECFTDPVTGKRTSRTIKPFGYVEKDLEEDPDFMAKVYAECDLNFLATATLKSSGGTFLS